MMYCISNFGLLLLYYNYQNTFKLKSYQFPNYVHICYDVQFTFLVNFTIIELELAMFKNLFKGKHKTGLIFILFIVNCLNANGIFKGMT